MINVLIVDSTRILRESLLHLIEKDSELRVVGSAENGLQAVESCGTLAPDVVLMDVAMPECDGIEATRIIKRKFSTIKVVILTHQTDKEYVASALKSGADGYLFKDIKGSELVLAVKCVAGNMRVYHHDVLEGLDIYIENRNPINQTRREIELIRYIAQGKSNKEIAGILNLSEGRIKNIITGILKKNDLQDRTQLAVYAITKRYI
ncbi:response regulator transcription factor [Tumebacillus sp. ITR2]|uniref:Response regulator transcription factor n=1 Tax=Tumebacillus amylolyticus TaxID=2801339 RepID=A0ABS1J9E4_9BACL|nr:response regulator transcription factor [Tumebacillus amylolyticus]MBL0386898.1 response regulator transcription factor [Tumebacillus amylolyticus]